MDRGKNYKQKINEEKTKKGLIQKNRHLSVTDIEKKMKESGKIRNKLKEKYL